MIQAFAKINQSQVHHGTWTLSTMTAIPAALALFAVGLNLSTSWSNWQGHISGWIASNKVEDLYVLIGARAARHSKDHVEPCHSWSSKQIEGWTSDNPPHKCMPDFCLKSPIVRTPFLRKYSILFHISLYLCYSFSKAFSFSLLLHFQSTFVWTTINMSLTNFANGTETVDLLLFNTEPYPLGPALGASVLYANPTATAYVLNCMNGTNPDACGTYNQSVTIGPWAQTSAGAATGVYDAYINLSTQSATVSVHCDMSSTVPATCTMTQNLGGSDMPGATATAAVWTTPASNYSAFSWGYMPV